MIVGKIVGSVVSTRKYQDLVGCKFMIVEPIMKSDSKKRIVAVDNIGAGIGEIVLVAEGSAARVIKGMENSPIDAAIVGIVDDNTGLTEVE